MVQFIPEGFTGKTILDEHNVEYRIPQRLAQTSKNLLLRLYATGEWQRLRHFEERACRMADVVLAVSDEDRAALATHGANVATYPIGVDLDYFHPIRRNPDADMIVSIGTMYWLPNVEGIQWFVKDILPLVHEKRPQTRLRIVGAKPTPEVEALASDQIEVTGFVNDTRETVTDCGVFIVPLRSGSGMRVKILNAMAMGLPLVSTTVGAEGIAVTHGENCLLADTPADFAKAILHLLQNPAEAQRLGTNARCLMEAQYGWEAVTGRLLETYAEVLG
jgi:glycosyltransferase involved in cell wall biosynthesis